MTNKVELNVLSQVIHKEQAFLTALNENFDRIQAAINDTLSRTGVVPNQMEEILDMNGKRIINTGVAEGDNDVITKRFIKDVLAEVEAAVERADTLINQAIAAVEVYASEHIYPVAQAAVDAAIDAKDLAKGYADSAKDYYDDTKDLYDDLADVRASLSSLLELYDHLADVVNVSNNMSDVQTVSGISTDVSTVSGIASVVSAVADNAADITAVNANKVNIDKVAGDINRVNLVADDISSVHDVAVNINDVIDVNNNKTNIDKVAYDIENVTTVGNNISNVNSVANAIENVNAVANDLENLNAIAGDLDNIDAAPTYAALAKKWAIGYPSEPAEGSSRYWAERAHEYTEGVLKEGLISNRILEIPQDIKLELNNGTLTLKSGSIITRPDGTQVQTTEDKSVSTATTTGQCFVWAASGSGGLQSFSNGSRVARCGSGATLPADNTDYTIFFNTTDSKIYSWTVNGWAELGVALPLGIVSCSNSTITSIDKVFNGIGFMGTAIFALPGIRYLATDGLNLDGTLKSIDLKTSSLYIRNFTLADNNYSAWLNHNKQIGANYSTLSSYDEKQNYIYSSGMSGKGCYIVDFTISSGAISKFEVRKPFNLLQSSSFIDVKDFGAVGDGTVDDTPAFQSAIDSVTNTGTIFVPKGNYNVTVANIDLKGKTINYLLANDVTLPDNIPGAVFKSGKFTLPESSIQNTRNVRIHQYVDVGNSIAGQDDAKEYGIHVHGVIPEDGITTYTAQEFRAFSYDVESQKAFDEGSIYGIKGRIYGNGGSANLRSMYAFAEANNGFTGYLTGLLATVYVNGQNVNEAVALRANCSDGTTSGVEVGGAGPTPGGQMSYGYRIRTGAGQPGMPTVASYMAHGGCTGDMFLGLIDNTDTLLSHATVRIKNDGRMKVKSHCTNTATIEDDHVAILDVGFGTYDGIIKFYFRGTLETYGECYYRASGNANITKIYGGSKIDVLNNTVLTGTTGADGKITLSTTNDGKLYVENREGNTRDFICDIMASI